MEKKESKFVNLDVRYSMLFSLENVYGIYRTKNIDKEESLNYELVCFNIHESITSIDVLKDVMYMIRIGALELLPNDIVCIRVNGLTTSYRYTGFGETDADRILESYIEVPRFLDTEYKQVIAKLHEENKVLSVLEGKAFDIKEIGADGQDFFCIDLEVFKNMTEYSLYILKDMEIYKINPYSKPFTMVENALYYYEKANSGKKNKSILLLNRYELEMVKDYHQLSGIVV